MNDPYIDPPKTSGKRTLRRHKKWSRNNLLNALAVARERYEDELNRVRQQMLRNHEWLNSLSEEEKAKHLSGSTRHFRGYHHPDSPEGQKVLEIWTRWLKKTVDRLECEWERFEEENHGR